MTSSIYIPKRTRILIIDDQEANVSALRSALEAEGFYNISGVTDPRRAVTEFKEFSPDLVLLDWTMPAVGGAEVLAEIRTLRTADYVPIVVLTANQVAHVRQLALNLGASSFLMKPLDFGEVLNCAIDLLSLRNTGCRFYYPEHKLKPFRAEKPEMTAAWFK
jgi:PleD family two-component response regulator